MFPLKKVRGDFWNAHSETRNLKIVRDLFCFRSLTVPSCIVMSTVTMFVYGELTSTAWI